MAKAFLSCSYNKKYRPAINFFKDIITSCGFECVLIDEVQGKPVPEKIKEAIQCCEVFVLLVVEPPSDFILNEIGIAYTLNKDIIAVVEEEVRIGGILKSITDYATFSNKSCWSVVPQVNKLLIKLHEKHKSIHTIPAQLVRKHVNVTINITRAYINNTTEIELLNLSEKLQDVNHGLLLYNKKEETTDEILFKLKMISHSIKYKLTKWRTGHSLNYKIDFIPPLKRGDLVKYAYIQKLQNHYPKTKKGNMRINRKK